MLRICSANWNLLFSYGGTAIVFKAANRNYTIIFITYNESSVIPKFPTCSAVFTVIRLHSFLRNASEGHGIIKMGNSMIPFSNLEPKDSDVYQLITTKPGERKKQE